MKQEPKILYSDLTQTYYYVSSYDVIDEHHFRAKKKTDITKQLREIGLIK